MVKSITKIFKIILSRSGQILAQTGLTGILAIFDSESKMLFELKVDQRLFSSKINLKPVADIFFDLRNKFHANRMKFGDEEKIFICQF
jgi:hypothetical protein